MSDHRIIAALRPYMLQARYETLIGALNTRMCGLTVVLESLYDPGNQAAVFRSADAQGLTDVHIIKPENATKKRARSVSRGAEKWLSIHTHRDGSSCVERLREEGFQIAVSDLQAATPLESMDFSRPTALVFGSERFGVSEAMRGAADVRFKISMRGFVQSFNISVAAAITLHVARQRRERALGAVSDLPPDLRRMLLARWMRQSVAHSSKLLRDAGIEAASLGDVRPWEERLAEIQRGRDGAPPAIGIGRERMRGRLDNT